MWKTVASFLNPYSNFQPKNADDTVDDLMSDSSMSGSKTMSELEDLVSSNRKEDLSDTTIEEKISVEVKQSDEGLSLSLPQLEHQ